MFAIFPYYVEKKNYNVNQKKSLIFFLKVGDSVVNKLQKKFEES